jgi:hypothetical protein
LATAHALAIDDSHDARTILVMTLLVPMAKDPTIAIARHAWVSGIGAGRTHKPNLGPMRK